MNGKIIFKGEYGTIGLQEDGVNFYSYGAGHMLCVELAKEIIRLRAELAKPLAIVEPITGPG